MTTKIAVGACHGSGHGRRGALVIARWSWTGPRRTRTCRRKYVPPSNPRATGSPICMSGGSGRGIIRPSSRSCRATRRRLRITSRVWRGSTSFPTSPSRSSGIPAVLGRIGQGMGSPLPKTGRQDDQAPDIHHQRLLA